jgi:signal transduction histidine kinase
MPGNQDRKQMGTGTWLLWISAFALILSLAATVFALYISLLRTQSSSGVDDVHVYNLSVGLWGLLGVFILCTIWKQKQLNRLRERLHLEAQQLHALRARFDEVIDLFRAAFTHEGTLSLSNMLDIITHRCVDALHGQHASVMLLDDTREHLVTRSSYGVGREFAADARCSMGEGIAGKVLERKQPILLPDDDESSASVHPHRHITSAMSVPILGDGSCLGVLNVSRINHPIPFSRSQLGILSIFATHVGSMLQTAADLERFRARSHELEQEKIRLEEFGKIKDIFLSTASHELKTPLTAVIGYAELLGDPQMTGEAQKKGFLQKLQGEAARLLGLIDNILDFTRLETGKTRLKRQRTSLTELLHTTVETVTPMAVKNGLVIEEQHFVEDLHMDIDEVQMRQVFINLLTNAVRYSPSGETIRVSSQITPTGVVVSVTDHGPGIDVAERSHIFTVFGQGLCNGTSKGLGIGLYLVQRIVELHGGTVSLDSSVEPGASGSTFSVHLPIAIEGGQLPEAA